MQERQTWWTAHICALASHDTQGTLDFTILDVIIIPGVSNPHNGSGGCPRVFCGNAQGFGIWGVNWVQALFPGNPSASGESLSRSGTRFLVHVLDYSSIFCMTPA